MCFDIQLGNIGSYISFLPEVREMTLLVEGSAVFYLTARNPPIVRVELISGYVDCLLHFGELEFPLDLTVSCSKQLLACLMVPRLPPEAFAPGSAVSHSLTSLLPHPSPP